MQTLTDIWTKRMALLENKTWNGDDPKSGFDFTLPIEPHIPYRRSHSFADLSIRDLRSALTDILSGVIPEDLDQDRFQITDMGIHQPFVVFETKNVEEEFPITIIAASVNMQPQFTIHLYDYTTLSVSWYKNRGRIDSIINTEYGQEATLEEVTDILVGLGLEEPYEHPYY